MIDMLIFIRAIMVIHLGINPIRGGKPAKDRKFIMNVNINRGWGLCIMLKLLVDVFDDRWRVLMMDTVMIE